jgi:hypothetical protein
LPLCRFPPLILSFKSRVGLDAPAAGSRQA